MKQFILAITLLCLPFVITSCGDDDDGSVRNGFNYNGEFYSVDMNFDVFHNPGDRSFVYTFKATYDATNEEIVGTDVNLIDIDFQYDPTVSTLPEGTYTFNADNSTANTFLGEVKLGLNTTTDIATTVAPFTAGTVTVTRVAEGTSFIYTLNFNMTTATGPVSGTVNLKTDQLIID